VDNDHDETNRMSSFPPVCTIGVESRLKLEHLGAVPFNDRFVPFTTYRSMIGTSCTAEVLRQAEREAGGLLCDVGGPKKRGHCHGRWMKTGMNPGRTPCQHAISRIMWNFYSEFL